MTLAEALNIADLRTLAQRRLPRMAFDYIDGGADDEVTLAANEARLRAHRLVWDVLVDIAAIDGRTRALGGDMRLPFFISPTAASRLFHTAGECAVARAAGRAGVAYSLSTMGSATIEDVAAATSGPKHFQVYVWKDRGLVREVLQRAKAAGFTSAILTVDVPVAGNRERDPRNSFTIPPQPSLSAALQVLARPAWLADLVRGPPIRPENFSALAATMTGGIMQFINDQFDRSVTWRDAAWMVEQWQGPFAIKGVATPTDARRCLEIGASAVWVSNHGGRQLDGAPATIDLLEPVVDAVRGDAEVIFDGGVRRGGDIVKALALGATACAIGRAYLWGLSAAGEAGVARALTILEQEFVRTMQLLGARTIKDLRRDMVRAPVFDAPIRP
ncbi:MAG: alpha-hydroxy-acid oxidizing protein [Alphaproteobacteria bacterium]|nr:alpha-hydroxy-acid oxidizing protein [Alphaproteobacteria bacterium]